MESLKQIAFIITGLFLCMLSFSQENINNTELKCGYDQIAKAYSSKKPDKGKATKETPNNCSVVRVYYILPSDATRKDRADLCMRAVKHNWDIWNKAGRPFSYTKIKTLVTPHNTNWWLTNTKNHEKNGLQAWEYLSNIETYLDENTDFELTDIENRAIAFIEMKAPGVSAYGNSHWGVAGMPEWVIDGIEKQIDLKQNMPLVGVVGHELGHTFGMPHRACDKECAPRSVMCNGSSSDCDKEKTAYPDVTLSKEDLANLDGYKDYFTKLSDCKSTLSVENLNADISTITIYPNPSNGYINIDGIPISEAPVKINIFSIEGKLLYSDTLTNTKNNSINLSQYTGILFIKIQSKQSLNTYKVIIN